jgi:hypothetical protein
VALEQFYGKSAGSHTFLGSFTTLAEYPSSYAVWFYYRPSGTGTWFLVDIIEEFLPVYRNWSGDNWDWTPNMAGSEAMYDFVDQRGSFKRVFQDFGWYNTPGYSVYEGTRRMNVLRNRTREPWGAFHWEVNRTTGINDQEADGWDAAERYWDDVCDCWRYIIYGFDSNLPNRYADESTIEEDVWGTGCGGPTLE